MHAISVMGQFEFPQVSRENFYLCRPQRHLATAKRKRGRVEGSRRCVPCVAVTGNSTDDLLGFCSISPGSPYVQNAWREPPETDGGGRHILGVLRLALIPLPAPARAKAARSGGPVRGTRAALRRTSP